jgi:hypothetical protein
MKSERFGNGGFVENYIFAVLGENDTNKLLTCVVNSDTNVFPL